MTAKYSSFCPESESGAASDIHYWPEWFSTLYGRRAHLLRLDDGETTDRALCGITLDESATHRYADDGACQRCCDIADRLDKKEEDRTS